MASGLWETYEHWPSEKKGPANFWDTSLMRQFLRPRRSTRAFDSGIHVGTNARKSISPIGAYGRLYNLSSPPDRSVMVSAVVGVAFLLRF
jgi:hypothetical protein